MNTATATKRPSIEVIEDCEGDGTCLACGREGLRWVATLTDGQRVGLECAKAVLGFKPAPKSYTWVTGYMLTEQSGTSALWTRKDGRAAVITRHGAPAVSGPAAWIAPQWAAE